MTASAEVTWTGAWIARCVNRLHDAHPEWNDTNPTLKSQTVAAAQRLRDRLMHDEQAIAAIVYYAALHAVLDADEAVL